MLFYEEPFWEVLESNFRGANYGQAEEFLRVLLRPDIFQNGLLVILSFTASKAMPCNPHANIIIKFCIAVSGCLFYEFACSGMPVLV